MNTLHSRITNNMVEQELSPLDPHKKVTDIIHVEHLNDLANTERAIENAKSIEDVKGILRTLLKVVYNKRDRSSNPKRDKHLR